MAGDKELPDARELAARMAEIGERSNRIFRKFLERQDDESFQIPDPKVVTDALPTAKDAKGGKGGVKVVP